MAVLVGVDGFKFGADPELFLCDGEGKLQSAHGVIPGTKQEPYPVEYGAIQVDGMAAEFNIDPVDNFEAFNHNIVAVMRQLHEKLPKGWKFVIKPAVNFSQDVLDAQPETAKQLGCDPDYNAWTGLINPTPDASKDPTLRTASGHAHLGWTSDMPISDTLHFQHGCDLVKQLDWFLGAWSVRHDPDVTRRKLYGKAGAMRPKPYGVEYRVLSNFWIASKDLRRFVWNRMQAAIESMRTNEFPKTHAKRNEEIQAVINTGEMKEAFRRAFFFPVVEIL